MTRNDLLFVGRDGGLDTITLHRQPTTDDIWIHSADSERYVIQLIGGQFLVYDLKTLSNRPIRSIGVPVYSTEDLDAAIAWAVMAVGAGL